MTEKMTVKGLLLQAFLTGWEQSENSLAQDEYLESSIRVIEVLQVEPETIYGEEGLGLVDDNQLDHLDDLVRVDGCWLYFGVEAENYFILQWYADKTEAKTKCAELKAQNGAKAYLVDFSLKRMNASTAENFSGSSPNQLRS